MSLVSLSLAMRNVLRTFSCPASKEKTCPAPSTTTVALAIFALWCTVGSAPAESVAPAPGTLTPRERVLESREVYQSALDALAAGDTIRFAERVTLASEFRPDHPILLFNAACAASILGDREAALLRLERLAAMGLSFDARNDADLAKLSGEERFQQAVLRSETNGLPRGTSEPAVFLPDREFLPEGVAHDAESGDFFVGSIRQRRIVRVKAPGEPIDLASRQVDAAHVLATSGETAAVAEFADREDRLWSVFALAVPDAGGTLWAGTAAMANTPGVDSTEIGRSGIRVFDLDTGDLLRAVDLPRDDRRHILNDFVIARGDIAYCTDNQSGELYRLAPDASAFERIPLTMDLLSPQGIVLSPDEQSVLIADYSLGLVRVTLADGTVTLLSPPADACLLGIDGLARRGNELLAVQNGVVPNRALRIIIDSSGSSIETVEVLQSGHARFDEPTLGTVVGDWFYYVGNSQWQSLDDKGGVAEGYPLQEPVILRVRL